MRRAEGILCYVLGVGARVEEGGCGDVRMGCRAFGYGSVAVWVAGFVAVARCSRGRALILRLELRRGSFSRLASTPARYPEMAASLARIARKKDGSIGVPSRQLYLQSPWFVVRGSVNCGHRVRRLDGTAGTGRAGKEANGGRRRSSQLAAHRLNLRALSGQSLVPALLLGLWGGAVERSLTCYCQGGSVSIGGGKAASTEGKKRRKSSRLLRGCGCEMGSAAVYHYDGDHGKSCAVPRASVMMLQAQPVSSWLRHLSCL